MAVSNPKRSPSGRRSNRKRGQAMVEFALVIPIFMLVLSGILDFGFALFQRMTVINAARDGARAAVMINPVDATTMSLVVSTAKARAAAAAQEGGISVDQANVTVVCVPTQSSACSFTDAAHPPQTGDSVSVTVNYTYPTFFPLAFGLKIPMSATVQMVIE